MSKLLKVYTKKPFAMFDHVNGVYITNTPVEVESNTWLEAQIESGLVVVERPETEPVKSTKSIKSSTKDA